MTAVTRQKPRMLAGAGRFPELCELASDCTVDTALNLPGKWLIQQKVDGIRCLYADGYLFTREGGPMDCALHAMAALQRIEQATGEPMFFDGEYVEDDGFEATLAAFRKGEGRGKLWLFDALPLKDWKNGTSPMGAQARVTRLYETIHAGQSPWVGLLNTSTGSARDAVDLAKALWPKGGEGVVIKAHDAPYVRRRSADWKKIKQSFTATGPIVDMAERKDGTLRSIIVRTEHGPAVMGCGWGVEEGRLMLQLWRDETPMTATITYELTCGTKRTVRGGRFLCINPESRS